MALGLKSLTTVRASDRMPFLLIYGPEKVGKTSLACQFPDPIFLRVECGPPDEYDLAGWDIIDYYHEDFGLMTALDFLERGEHDFKTVVLDSMSTLETKIIWPQLCSEAGGADKGFKHIEDFGYGKGYKLAIREWEFILDRLNVLRNERGMTCILVGHSIVREFKNPETQAYDVYDVAIHPAAAEVVKRAVDGIFFIKPDTVVRKEDPTDKNNKRVLAVGGATRSIYTAKRDAFSAGNRYGMPDRIEYQKGNGFPAIAEHIPSLNQFLDVSAKRAA